MNEIGTDDIDDIEMSLEEITEVCTEIESGSRYRAVGDVRVFDPHGKLKKVIPVNRMLEGSWKRFNDSGGMEASINNSYTRVHKKRKHQPKKSVRCVCEACDKDFMSTSTKARVCTKDACVKLSRRAQKRGITIRALRKILDEVHTCEGCGKKFKTNNPRFTKYCQNPCNSKYIEKKIRSMKVTNICVTCKEPFELVNSRASLRKYCNNPCTYEEAINKKLRKKTKKN